MSRLTAAPSIADVQPNSLPFLRQLRLGGSILANSGMGMYSRHYHPEFPVGDGKVVFEKKVGDEELVLYPMTLEEARRRGYPSCWGVAANGEVIELRYADKQLHASSTIDVTSSSFLAGLARGGRMFAERGLHRMLEINIAASLFPPGEGRITREDTLDGIQRVTIVETPPEVLRGDWTNIACWTPGPLGELYVTGYCSSGSSSHDGGVTNG